MIKTFINSYGVKIFKKYVIIILLCIILTLLLSNLSFSQDSYTDYIEELEGKEIAEINYEGLSEDNKIKLLDYLNLISVGEPFIFTKVKLMFNELWSTDLFSNIIVDAKLNEDDKVILTFKFIELPKIQEIKIQGNILIPLYKLEGEISYVSAGDALKESDIQKDIKNLIEFYKSQGIINTSITYRTQETEQGKYILIFSIIEGTEVYIEDITIHGADKVASNKILRVMQTKQSTFYDIERPFDKDLLEKDKINIINLYYSLGYLDARIDDITHEIKPVDEDSNILGYYIDIYIDEGEQYTFSGMEFEGNTVFSNEELKEEIDLNKGEPIDKSKIDIGKETIRFKYYEKGYLYANIIPQIDKDTENYQARVVISIHEDQRAHIESIEIIGTDSEEYILDRLYELKEGEIFNLSKLIQTRENILNTGYFKPEGTIWQLSQGSQPGLIKLVWVVEEERLRSIFFTAEISLSSVTLKSDLQLVNFLGNGWDFNFLLELAGFERFKISSGVSTKWLFKYIPISFSTSISYSVRNVKVNPLLIGLVYTKDGYLSIPGGFGIGSNGVDLNGDGIIDGYDSVPIDLNNDGVIDEKDRVEPYDADGNGIYENSELSQGLLSYISHDFNFATSIGYEFTRGIESYFSFQTIISAAQNPRFGESSIVNIGGDTLKQFELTPDQIDLIFTRDSILYQELTTGWIATVGLTLGTNFNFTKVGAISYTGPLASEGWQFNASITPFFFGKQFIKYRLDFSTYYTIIPWGEFSDADLIFTARLGIEMLGPLGESIISDDHISPGDLVSFDGMTELRGFYNYNRDLSGYGKWIVQLELRGPLPGLEQIIWMVPFFLDWGNIGYNPRGYSLEFGLTSTPYYDPISGDLAVDSGNEHGHKFSFGFGFRVINIIPIQIYFAWPFNITTDGIQRVTLMNNGNYNETPWWPEFVISSFLYF